MYAFYIAKVLIVTKVALRCSYHNVNRVAVLHSTKYAISGMVTLLCSGQSVNRVTVLHCNKDT